MFTFTHFLSVLQAGIALASSRDRSMPWFFIELWNRVGRMGRRLEKLVNQWRAGTLPAPRARPSQAGERPDRVRNKALSFGTARGWLIPRVHDAAKFGAMLEALLTQEECVRFLVEVPQARKIVGVLARMLIPDPTKPPPKMRRAAVWPPVAWQEAVSQANMHVGPKGRLEWN